MKSIKIVCDSLSDITDEYIEKYDIELIPLNVIIDEKEYKDRRTITNDEFYKMIRNEGVIPTTSQINYLDYLDVFDELTKNGDDLLYIAASSNATGTMQSAMMAKNDLEDRNIRIFDSNSLCFGVGILVLEACKLREEGKSIDEIVDVLEKLKEKVYVSFFCDDLEFLKRGGRISGTKAVLGNVLGIKPICVIDDGLVENVANARGKKNVVSKMVEVAREQGISDLRNEVIYVGYTDDLVERDRLEEKLREEFNPKDIEYFQIGCGIGTHGGPGVTGFITFNR